jgi:CBS-domain-containing membrane protein
MSVVQDIFTVTCGSLVSEKTITISASYDESIESVLHKLQKHDLLSLPVYDKENEIIGLVSVLDIMTYISWGKYFRSEDVTDEEVTMFRHLSHTVGTLLEQNKGAENVWVYPPETRINDILEPYSKGVHRVLIPQKDTEGKVVHRVLSQTDIVKYLYSNKHLFSSLLTETIAGLQLGTYSVISVTSDTIALDAFKKMSQQKLSAVAIVDKENAKLVGNLSASDLRGLNAQKLPSIIRYVGNFLVAQHGYVKMPLTVTPQNTLEDVITILLEKRVHRVWIVDESRKPTGVITMTDVLMFAFKQSSKKE